MGDLDSGIRQSKVEKFWRGQLNAECDGCYARSACGGECKIVSYYRYGRIDGLDANMCKIKKYLYAAAMYFIDKLKNGNSNIYNWLISETKKINSYYDADDKLIETVEASQGKYTFTQLKKIKDENIEDFEKIRREVYENRKIL